MEHSNRMAIGHATQPLPLDMPAWHHAIHDRVLKACGGRSGRGVAKLVGMNSETVQRTLRGQRPSVEFLVKLSEAMGLSGDWLLTGNGPMRRKNQVAASLKQASEMQLGAEMGARLEKFTRACDVPNRTRSVTHSNGHTDGVNPDVSLPPCQETAEHGTRPAKGGLSA